MRHVLLSVEVLVVGRDLDSALPAAGAEEEAGARVVHHAAVNGKVIVVEALVHRTCGGAPPVAVVSLVENGSSLSAESEADDD